MNNIPKWAWTLIGAMLVIVVCVVLKINLSVGSEGIHFTQGLVK